MLFIDKQRMSGNDGLLLFILPLNQDLIGVVEYFFNSIV